MTSDEFTAAYRTGHCLTSDGIKTSLAQESRKGRLVLVHELANATEPERLRVHNLLARLAPNDASQVIGAFDVDGETIVVTKFLLGFTSFLAWLEAAVAESSTTVLHTADDPPTIDMHVHDPRSYRRPLAERSVAPALEDTSVQPVVASKPVLASPVAQPAPTPVDESSPQPPAASTARAPADSEPTAGFTQLFGEPVPTASPLQAAADRDAEGPVDFTELFGASAGISALPSQHTSHEKPDESLGIWPEPLPSASPSPASRVAAPGHDAPSRPDGVKSSAADEHSTGDFTRLFGDQPAMPPAGLLEPKPPPIGGVSTAQQQPAPSVGRSPGSVSPLNEIRAPSSPQIDESLPLPPPRLRLEALEGSSGIVDSASRRGLDSGARENASVPPAPFSVPPLISGPSSPTPASSSPISRPDPRAAATPPVAIPATPPQGGYTEVLTPARPPLNVAAARTPTPSISQAPQSTRSSYTPLIVGLVVFVVLVAIVLTFFVMSSA